MKLFVMVKNEFRPVERRSGRRCTSVGRKRNTKTTKRIQLDIYSLLVYVLFQQGTQ